MRLDVMDTHYRDPKRIRQRLRKANADEQGADEARTVAYTDASDLTTVDAPTGEQLFVYREYRLDVLARRDFGYDSAVALVYQLARGQDCDNASICRV